MLEAKQQKEEWFEAFYQRNYLLVYKLCFTYMKNSSEAEDCTEDVFVKVLSGNFTFNDETHEKKWLTLTAINLCKDRLKQWWRKKVVVTNEMPEIPVNTSSPYDETLEAVMSLPTKYKDVIYLYYYLDYKTDEIASQLGKPSSTIRNYLHEARELLRNKIGDLDHE